ncbi:sensor histidine kinase [Pseudonocardia nigra]|uniref:sensor histidine kinase n=1 Tax=Pseudonocardia nigra TaxID=1921578 RepID=UPI001C5E2CC7|nr:ATP-binding protein [Pseudonocardia nigra]
MQTMAPTGPPVEEGREDGGRGRARLLEYLPRGNTLDEKAFRRRHRLLQWVLLLHVPALLVLGLALGNSPVFVGCTLIAPVVGLVLGQVVTQRRMASFFTTGGYVFSSAALVLLTSGSIEAHFHFFIIIGFIALYQDWVPFLWNVTFTVVSHGVGTIWFGERIFNHPAAQSNPWLWSFVHGVAVLAACVGMVIFWRITEDEQTEKEALGKQLVTADAEIGRRRFASAMLVNLARRNQSMLYRQLDIINQLEEKEQDPDALADLFTLDHLATRVRRNAESLLVLAGEQPPRTWSAPVPLRDVVRAAIAETEDLDRVVFAVDDHVALSGYAVADLTHLLAELTENAVRFSPPDTLVTIRARPDRRTEGAHLLTVEDWGVGMPPDDLAAANDLLSHPREVDLDAVQRLGFHVVARLAARHGIAVSLGATPGAGVSAVVALPAALFAAAARLAENTAPAAVGPAVAEPRPYVAARVERPQRLDRPQPTAEPAERPERPAPATRRERIEVHVPPQAAPPPAELVGADAGWRGWWNPESAHAEAHPAGAAASNGASADAPGAHGLTANRHVVRPPADRPSPVPRPRPEVAPPSAPTKGLRRRVPQAHLAPELRTPSAGGADENPQHDAGAASALSRYQASRQAAQAFVDRAGAQTGERS